MEKKRRRSIKSDAKNEREREREREREEKQELSVTKFALLNLKWVTTPPRQESRAFKVPLAPTTALARLSERRPDSNMCHQPFGCEAPLRYGCLGMLASMPPAFTNLCQREKPLLRNSPMHRTNILRKTLIGMCGWNLFLLGVDSVSREMTSSVPTKI